MERNDIKLRWEVKSRGDFSCHLVSFLQATLLEATCMVLRAAVNGFSGCFFHKLSVYTCLVLQWYCAAWKGCLCSETFMDFVCIQGVMHVAGSIQKTSVALAAQVGLWIKPEVGARCPPALAVSGHLWLLFLLLLEAACCGKFSVGTALDLLVNGNTSYWQESK